MSSPQSNWKKRGISLVLGCLAFFMFIPAFCAKAQDLMSLDDLIDAGNQWAQENLDDNVLKALNQVDQDKGRKLFQIIQQSLHGDYVVDLASVKQAAGELLPLLEQNAETKPYAAWLKARMDYFEVADQIKQSTPPPKTTPGTPPKPIPNPSPETQRKVWMKQVEKLPGENIPMATRLKEIFKGQKTPAELVWVAQVESSFNPAARSPAGAAGLFQLMPRTAKSLGLSLQPDDERLKPEKNAAAAARYLKTLHSRFKDWRLALAAYNAGEGTVQNLLAKYKAQTFDQIAVHLPAETQMYVPRIEAVILKREGKSLAQL